MNAVLQIHEMGDEVGALRMVRKVLCFMTQGIVPSQEVAQACRQVLVSSEAIAEVDTAHAAKMLGAAATGIVPSDANCASAVAQVERALQSVTDSAEMRERFDRMRG